jgi:hypothetical protein
LWTPGLPGRTSKPLVAVCFVRAGHFEELVADAYDDHSIAVQFRRSQQGFQYGLLLAHNSLLSEKGTIYSVPPAHADKISRFNFVTYLARFPLPLVH